jgi:hypothetical protein
MAVIDKQKAGIGHADMLTDDAVAKVSIVGVGIRSNPELSARKCFRSARSGWRCARTSRCAY